MQNKSTDSFVTVIGAGPYGLSAAAYLRAAKVETRAFGEPMAFWQKHMPVGMCLRSNLGASHIADPRREFTIDEYCRQNGNHVGRPIPLERFVSYGLWFQQRVAPDVDQRSVRSVEIDARGFRVSLADGEQFASRHVVVAAGIGAFMARPAEFADIPSALASHASEHNDLRKFVGKRVVVIGAGQSALESAALLKE
ncbi:MAG: NAD(P)-binding domain-containing protein, partial [Candidatus Sulfotelmatobacter sp.]